MYFFSSPVFLLVLAIIRVTVGVPLGIDYDKTEGLTAEELENKGRLDQATTDAHAQVQKMREGFNKYKEGDEKATALYEASFGKNADPDKVDKTITALETENLRAKVGTHDFGDSTIASVPWSSEKKGKPWIAGDAQFSAQFHGHGPDGLDNAGRAGTVIHEATHQMKKTGDDVNLSGNIIKAYDGTSKQSGATGYTSNPNMHKTVAEVNADTSFTDVRDTAKNMHDNAESYAVFGSLCSQPGALRRRDVDLYNRALMEGDHEQLAHLARRNSCQLPKDYFTKKPAANKSTPPSKGAQAAAKGGSQGTPKKPLPDHGAQGAKSISQKGKTPAPGAAKGGLIKPGSKSPARLATKPSSNGASKPGSHPVSGAASRIGTKPASGKGHSLPSNAEANLTTSFSSLWVQAS
ncbi:hypothetical protein NLI96_g12699 [Meripilus lineatus]|uniref:Lysine-specific metallo-endopeptidase domain-containing protein n=1 Tax=Meripilus lineatus TaxID=2056292 RepID=A0AAD5Y7C3_9APHY|nr:hypothetical protein NLI96_g12699 [Physisporinus lineatus]